jgi:GST-like protein
MDVIELFFVTSPNVYKIVIALEEMALPYTLRPVDLSAGAHLDPANVAGVATGKLPVIRDDEPADGGEPVVVFESGAILQYLGEKSGKLLPAEPRARLEVMQWLFWQMGGLGPVGGQFWHFLAFAPKIAPDFDNSYAFNRYSNMWTALWRTMDRQLAERPYLAGDYSIADIACFPWIIYIDPRDGIDRYPNVRRWRDDIGARPAVRNAYANAGALDTGYERNEKGASLFPWEGLVKHVIVT